jgi:predicted O-methyltransferase YrrM
VQPPPDPRQDVEYVPTYHGELAPGHIDFALLLAGIEPPRRVGMRYLELGFGQGTSVSIHAAAAPGEYWGTDFNPAQAAHAKGLAQVAGAEAKFFADSFADFAARDDLPRFDYIVLHGIWSWVSEENRRILVGILRDRLKVGGVVYAGYNVLPAWAPFMPIRALLRERAAVVGIEAAIEAVIQLASVDPRYFTETSWLAKRLNVIRTEPANYLAHDYFTDDWSPCYFAEIAEAFAASGLSYAGPARPIDRLDLQLSAAQIAYLGAIAPDQRETARDYLSSKPFRQDLFTRGARTLSPEEQTARLRDTAIMLLVDRRVFSFEVVWRGATLNLNRAAYAPLLDILALDGGAPRRIGELADHPGLGRLPAGELLRMIALLLGVGIIGLIQDAADTELAAPRCHRLNGAITDRVGHLASPVLGGGLPVSAAERAAIASRQLDALAGDVGKHRASLLKRLLLI